MIRIFLLLFLVFGTRFCADYYKLLGIQKDAENREIRKAFKVLALKYHPDKNQGEADAHEKFIKINKAYEVLKDEEMRKKYDLYGEEGLKEDFGKTWKGSYRSWNYYHESFGIYDDDPEIISLSHNDFDRSVLDSPYVWFVNFYSPQCSHCHHLASAWRKLAHQLQDVIQIGAVNCEEDWMLCRKQNVYAYPTLIIYPKKEIYQGSREADDMMEYILEMLPYNIIQLDSSNYSDQILSQKIASQPWLTFSCRKSIECFPRDNLKKLSIILEHLVYIAEIDNEDNNICELISCDSPITYFTNMNLDVPETVLNGIPINDTDLHEIVKQVLHLLPEPQVISSQDLEEIRRELEDTNSLPWLIQFTNDKVPSTEKDITLKRLKSFLPKVHLGHFNCYNQELTCSSFYILKFPSYLLFKSGGAYEFHYGSITAYDVARFMQEALNSQVYTLNPKHFPNVTQSKEVWFIDFFTPWCPPCMQFLPEWRKASSTSGHLLKFGTVDCSIHQELCRNYNIKSYPSAILYKQSVGHKFHGSHSQKHLDEFIQDILNPVVVSLSPSSFQVELENKGLDDIWLVDFFAPWCGPCQQLAPEWKKLARMLIHLPAIHIGEMDCQAYKPFCNSLGVNSFPTIRLFPRDSKSVKKFYYYTGMSRDASSLEAWIYNFLPSKVQLLSDIDFQNVLNDNQPWLIDFFAPWCSHCQTFAPEFEKIAEKVESIVKTGKINCVELPRICRLASIRAYPTVLFYKGQTGSKPQNPVAEEVGTLTFNGILSFIKNRINLNFKKSALRDEL